MLKFYMSLWLAACIIFSPSEAMAIELGIAPDGNILIAELPDQEEIREPDEAGEAETAKHYTVQAGDTLYRIALNHGLQVKTLQEWNGITGELIHPGDRLAVHEDAKGEVKLTEKKRQVAVATAAASPSKEMTVTATAYTAYCEGCSGTTYSGQNLRANPNQKVIAVDPRLIPIGSRVWVEHYGEAIAGDIGGAIKGHKIDVFIPSHDQAMAWGVKQVKIKVLN